MSLSPNEKIKGLYIWCQNQTKGYRHVEISNFTTSWRNGLGFCAILHRYDPDVIDFDDLDPNDIYENCQLAFEVGEQHFGIPALLEAKDMVLMKVPDRLSIITYLLQYYSSLANRKPKAQSKIDELSNSLNCVSSKKLTENEVDEPTATFSSLEQGDQIKCEICSQIIYFLERLTVKNKYYHRSCYRQVQLNSLKSRNNTLERPKNPESPRSFKSPRISTEVKTIKAFSNKKDEEIKSKEDQVEELPSTIPSVDNNNNELTDVNLHSSGVVINQTEAETNNAPSDLKGKDSNIEMETCNKTLDLISSSCNDKKTELKADKHDVTKDDENRPRMKSFSVDIITPFRLFGDGDVQSAEGEKKNKVLELKHTGNLTKSTLISPPADIKETLPVNNDKKLCEIKDSKNDIDSELKSNKEEQKLIADEEFDVKSEQRQTLIQMGKKPAIDLDEENADKHDKTKNVHCVKEEDQEKSSKSVLTLSHNVSSTKTTMERPNKPPPVKKSFSDFLTAPNTNIAATVIKNTNNNTKQDVVVGDNIRRGSLNSSPAGVKPTMATVNESNNFVEGDLHNKSPSFMKNGIDNGKISVDNQHTDPRSPEHTLSSKSVKPISPGDKPLRPSLPNVSPCALSKGSPDNINQNNDFLDELYAVPLDIPIPSSNGSCNKIKLPPPVPPSPTRKFSAPSSINDHKELAAESTVKENLKPAVKPRGRKIPNIPPRPCLNKEDSVSKKIPERPRVGPNPSSQMKQFSSEKAVISNNAIEKSATYSSSSKPEPKPANIQGKNSSTLEQMGKPETKKRTKFGMQLSQSNESLDVLEPRNSGFKKPAPSRPTPRKRIVRAEANSQFIPYETIYTELEDVNRKQSEIENKGRPIQEALCQVNEKDERYANLLEEWMDIVEKKNAMYSREHYLHEVLKRQELEDRHSDLEFELRLLLGKQEALKTAAERAREEELLTLLLETVDARSRLVDDPDSSDISSQADAPKPRSTLKQMFRIRTRSKSVGRIASVLRNTMKPKPPKPSFIFYDQN